MPMESASKGNNGGSICADFSARRTPFVQSSGPVALSAMQNMPELLSENKMMLSVNIILCQLH